MAKVLCTLENASTLIDSVKFEKTAKGMLSEEISDEQVKHYLSIPGFEVPAPEQAKSTEGAAPAGSTQGNTAPAVAPPSGGAASPPAPAGAPAQAPAATTAPSF